YIHYEQIEIRLPYLKDGIAKTPLFRSLHRYSCLVPENYPENCSLVDYHGRQPKKISNVISTVMVKSSIRIWSHSRGFGFVTFSEPANVSLVLQNGPHQLDGRTYAKTLRWFPESLSLGGLPSIMTETDLRSYFTRFGKVMEVVIMYDQEKKKSYYRDLNPNDCELVTCIRGKIPVQVRQDPAVVRPRLQITLGTLHTVITLILLNLSVRIKEEKIVKVGMPPVLLNPASKALISKSGLPHDYFN
ncbi:Uncharacterized protein DBV15_07142, partial [Temnothorax longispinosus]